MPHSKSQGGGPASIPGQSQTQTRTRGPGVQTPARLLEATGDDMASPREASAIAQKQLDQRNALWPGIEPLLWHRKQNKGFTTIPKTMPLILKIMDEMSNGKPVSSTYLGLWCVTWDNSFVNISKANEMAHAAGFTGQRAEYTWAARMKILKELGFINIKPGKSGPISHVIILNPHKIIQYHHEKKTAGLVEASYNMLIDRALDIGAKDMLEPLTQPAAPAPAAAPVAATPRRRRAR